MQNIYREQHVESDNWQNACAKWHVTTLYEQVADSNKQFASIISHVTASNEQIVRRSEQVAVFNMLIKVNI